MKSLSTAIFTACLTAISTFAVAEDWPSKPITMIVPYNPGGTTDNLARLAAEAISKAVGQPVVVENKPGAGGVVGTSLAARAPADGYTIFFGNNATNVVQPLINTAVQYDPEKDFSGIAETAEAATFLAVNAETGIKTLDEFVTYLKEHPGAKYGTAGVGSMGQFTVERFLQQTGATATHIPYQGSNNAMAAMMSGEITFMADPVVATQANSDKFTILASLTDSRHPNLPDVPTAKELGVDVVVSGWFGLFAPKGVNEAEIARMSTALEALVGQDDYRQRVLNMGLVPVYMGPQAVDGRVVEDLKVFGEIRDKAGIKID